MSAAIVVRDAAMTDLPTLVAFNEAMALETETKRLDRAVLERGVARLLAEPARGFYLVAERGTATGSASAAVTGAAVAADSAAGDSLGVGGATRIAGQLMVTFEWSDWRNADFWWFQSVYVAPEHRRAGVFRALHEETVRRAREAHACGMRLYVERSNEAAQATYRRLGMDASHYELFETAF